MKKLTLLPHLIAALILAGCGGGGNDPSPSNQASTPAAGSSSGSGSNSGGSSSSDPQTTAQFIALAQQGTGTTTLTTAPASVTFSGCLVKGKTSDPRSLGASAFLTNQSGYEYRLTNLSYVMDTSGLLSTESAESDIGFTVLPQNEVVALNSGEETLITHRYDADTTDRGIIKMSVPSGGVSISNTYRLSVGSTTGIFPKAGGGAETVADSRLTGGKFMQVCYIANLTRADLVSTNRVASYRSPYRDRSYVSDPSRTASPFTDFKNTSSKTVNVYGVGVFLSNLSDSEPSSHEVDVLVNGSKVQTLSLPSHVPGQSTALFPAILPVSVALKPGDILAVRGKVTPQRAIVFDFAAFIFADEGLTPINEQLGVLNADLNGDGYNDIVDIDANGSIWVSLRVGGGLQDTEQEWARSVKNVSSLQPLPRATSTDPLIIQATNSQGLCLNMTAMPSAGRFLLNYCQDNGDPSTVDDIWGDFNGDGWPDRMRVSASALTYSVALGSANGLGTASPWVNGYGPVDRMFVSDSNGDGLDDIEAEWSDTSGFRCVIWKSTGTAFNQVPCSN